MRSPKPLTEQQLQALELARRQGGKLYRNDAAWGPESFDPKTTPFADLFSFATVRALVTRRAMEWTERRGPSPIEATIAASWK